MNKEFIPYEPSLEFKQLGFNEPCFGYWKMSDWLIEEKTRTDGYTHADQLCSAPTFSQAFRWLLEKHNLYGIIIPTVTMDWTFKTMTVAQGMVEVPPYNHVDACDYSSREEAELDCLKKLIEIVKQKL
jgi:hypothetical protein